jgi:hypothetical protein
MLGFSAAEGEEGEEGEEGDDSPFDSLGDAGEWGFDPARSASEEKTHIQRLIRSGGGSAGASGGGSSADPAAYAAADALLGLQTSMPWDDHEDPAAGGGSGLYATAVMPWSGDGHEAAEEDGYFSHIGQLVKKTLISRNGAAITAALPYLADSLRRPNDAERDQLVKDILSSTNATAITEALPYLADSLRRANDAERGELVKHILRSKNAIAITTVIPYLAASLGRANEVEKDQLVKIALTSQNATAITEALPYLKDFLKGTHANAWVGPILSSQRAQAIALIVGPEKVVSSGFLQTWAQDDNRKISLVLATRSAQVVFALPDDVLAKHLVSTKKDVTSLPGGAPEGRIKIIKEIMDDLTGSLDEEATPPLSISKKITFTITWKDKSKSVEFKIKRAGKGSGNASLICFNAQLTDTICEHIIKIKEDKNNLSRIKSIVADILNEDIEEYRTLDLWRDFSAGKNEELKKNIIAAIEAVVLQIHSADGSADGSNEYGRKRQRTFEPSEGGGGSASAAGGGGSASAAGGGGSASAAGGGGSASAAGGGSGFYATATVEWSGGGPKDSKAAATASV